MRHHTRHRHACVVDRLEDRALLSFGAPGDGVFDVTFLGDLYAATDASVYHADIQKCIDSLATIEPYKSHFSQFAFHTIELGPSLGAQETAGHLTADYAKVDEVVVASGYRTDAAVVLVKNPFAMGTGAHQVPVLSNATGIERVFLHELSHSIGIVDYALLDEYVYSATDDQPYDNQAHQNIYAGEPPFAAWSDMVAPDEYFRGATYRNWYRTSPRSLMRYTDVFYFNAVSTELLNQALNYWAGPVADAVDPTAAFASLKDGDVVAGVVQVATSMTDNVGVTRAQLWVDGQLARNTTVAPFTLTWLTDDVAAGVHSLQVKAFDASGHVGVSPLIHVTLVEPSSLSITSPAAGATIGAAIDVGAFSAEVSGWADAISYVKVWVDADAANGKQDYSPPYAVSLSTRGLTAGPHTLTAVAYGVVGETEIHRATIPFTFDPLAVRIASPAADASVAGLVPVAIDVTQGHPDRVELTYALRSGGSKTLTRTAAPWVFDWNSMESPNGTVGLFVTAYESTGVLYLPISTVQVKNGYGKLDAPSAGAVVSGTTTIRYIAGNPFVSRVEAWVDGKSLGATTSGSTYEIPWNTLGTPNGSHTVRVVASNSFGWTDESSVSVTVKNVVNPVTLASPRPGATVKGIVPVTLAADPGAVKRLDVKVDGRAVATVAAAPFSWNWDTRGLADGAHTVVALATLADNTVKTFSVGLTVDNFVVTFTVGLPGVVVSGTVPLALTIPSGSPTAVVFGVDARTLGTVTRSPFRLNWSSTTVADGPHTLWARLTNAQGGTDVVTLPVTVRNDRSLPVVGWTSPANNARVGASLTVRGTATDPVGVARVELYIDGKLATSAKPVGRNFTLTANLATLSRGNHRFQVRALDTSGNVGWSSIRTFQRV